MFEGFTLTTIKAGEIAVRLRHGGSGPLPERMIGADPEAYYFHRGREIFAPEALADYISFVHDPAVIHAMCEDYRAGATCDFRLDEAERGKRRIAAPLLALWGAQGMM